MNKPTVKFEWERWYTRHEANTLIAREMVPKRNGYVWVATFTLLFKEGRQKSRPEQASYRHLRPAFRYAYVDYVCFLGTHPVFHLPVPEFGNVKG